MIPLPFVELSVTIFHLNDIDHNPSCKFNNCAPVCLSVVFPNGTEFRLERIIEPTQVCGKMEMVFFDTTDERIVIKSFDVSRMYRTELFDVPAIAHENVNDLSIKKEICTKFENTVSTYACVPAHSETVNCNLHINGNGNRNGNGTTTLINKDVVMTVEGKNESEKVIVNSNHKKSSNSIKVCVCVCVCLYVCVSVCMCV